MKLVLPFLLVIFSCQASAQSWFFLNEVFASDRDSRDFFGYSVAISGEYAIIGAPGEVLDEQGEDSLYRAGAVYFFQRKPNGKWSWIQKLVPSNREAEDFFGAKVAMSGDFAMVAAPFGKFEGHYETGTVYVFWKDSTGLWQEWEEIHPLSEGQDLARGFGFSLDMDGSQAIIGAYREANNPQNTSSISGAGAAYIYEKNPDDHWTIKQKLVSQHREPAGYFGYDVGIHGDYVIVGAAQEETDEQGENRIPTAGAAYIFERDSLGVWQFVQKFVGNQREAEAFFGNSVDIDGENALVESFETSSQDSIEYSHGGAVYIFSRDGTGSWQQNQQIVPLGAGDVQSLGSAVALSGRFAVIGAKGDYLDNSGENPLVKAGAALFLEKDSVQGVWQRAKRITPTPRSIQDQFGFAVSMEGNRAIIATPWMDEFPNYAFSMDGEGKAFFYAYPTPRIPPNPEPEKIIPFGLFPNPTSRRITIGLGQEYPSIGLRVWDVQGRIMLSQHRTDTDHVVIDLKGPPGLFLVEIRPEGEAPTRWKVLKR